MALKSSVRKNITLIHLMPSSPLVIKFCSVNNQKGQADAAFTHDTGSPSTNVSCSFSKNRRLRGCDHVLSK